MRLDSKPVALIITLSAVALGCADDELIGEPDAPCDKPNGECKEEGGNDEVGDGDGDESDGADDPYELCVAEDEGNGERSIYQCHGHLTASIEFRVGKKNCADLLGAEYCTETHYFGEGEEPYSMPAVMACCDAEMTPEDELLAYCAADLVSQVCASIPNRLEALLEQGKVPDFAVPQAKNLLSHLHAHQQDCWNALHNPGAPGVIGPVKWEVGNNKHWKSLEDFTVRLDKAVVESASLPDDGSEPLECVDNNYNDDEVFEARGPRSPMLGVDVYRLADSASVPIMGPRLPDGGHVQGSAKAASQSVCAEPRCSSLELGEDGHGLLLEDLNLYADGIANVAIGEMSLEIDRLALRLYGVVGGTRYQGNNGVAYVIEPGAAHFLVTGSIGDMAGARWAENLGPIRLHASDDGWTIEGFEVVHTDGLGGAWKASIPLTTWD